MTRRITPGAIALIAMVALGGCAAQPSDQPSSTAATAGPGHDQTVNQCPVGNWRLDNDSWEQDLSRLIAEEWPGAGATVGGALHLDWDADGSYVMTAENSSYQMSGESQGGSFEIAVIHDGVQEGQWSKLSSTRYDLTATDSSRSSTEISWSVDGRSVGDVDPGDVAPSPWEGEVTVSCDGDRMTTSATKMDPYAPITIQTVVVGWVPRD